MQVFNLFSQNIVFLSLFKACITGLWVFSDRGKFVYWPEVHVHIL